MSTRARRIDDRAGDNVSEVMRASNERRDLPGTGRSVVTIGTFDGVHLGHRRLIGEALRTGKAEGLRVVIVTFDRHPALTLRPRSAPRMLTGLAKKLELLWATGVDDILVLHFDTARAGESAEDFVETVLVDQLGASSLVVGENFRFGHKNLGDVALLESLGAAHGFSTRGLSLARDDKTGEVISATRVRTLIQSASLGEAARLLGRNHEVSGPAVELSGSAAGSFGIAVDAQLCMPPAGTYVARVGVPGASWSAGVVQVVCDVPEEGPFIIVTDMLPPDAVDLVPHRGVELRVEFLEPASPADGPVETVAAPVARRDGEHR